MDRNTPERPCLEIYPHRSVLREADGNTREFLEGGPSDGAKVRLATIRAAFENGFLTSIMEECKSNPAVAGEGVEPAILQALTRLVDSVTSEVGRAMVGLTVLQLAIKAIAPDQSIRLHKGGAGGNGFSWVDGVPMRVLDKAFNTPALRRFDLLRLNADGCFMTRSLAENYPYSKLYKAALRGARSEWLEIVDLIEEKRLDPLVGLKQTISMLFNRSAALMAEAERAVRAVGRIVRLVDSLDDGMRFILGYVRDSEYAARVFEIAMHALMQVLEDAGSFQGHLKPLSQMRSANKKHGNIGDVEITLDAAGLRIFESWDAKFGKRYLRDELDELNEKLGAHAEVSIAGFVVEGKPDMRKDIQSRRIEIEEIHDVGVLILSFKEWVRLKTSGAPIDGTTIARHWIIAFTECLCQKRRHRAPIDEPVDAWIAELVSFAKSWK